jgi:lipopolysaccharide export system protein LptA
MTYASQCLAERADREKPLQLDADQVLINDTLQMSTFSGSVKLSQGSLQILGDTVVVQNLNGFSIATITGKPASFHQKREGLNELIEGSGERIIYDTHTETIDFYNQARIKRDLDDVRGEHISYSAKTEVFQVNGKNDNTNLPPKRVRAIFQPKNKKIVPISIPEESSSTSN